jgi:acyl dehydratase
MAERYFEDFTVGEIMVSASASLSEAEIVAFARAYDPQPFHLDPEAARGSPFGGLIASGFQTVGLAFRLFYEEGHIAACSMGSPGMDKIRWHRPVRPGDAIRNEVEVRELRPSETKRDRGYGTLTHTVRNQDDEIVMTFTCTLIMRRRPHGTSDAQAGPA